MAEPLIVFGSPEYWEFYDEFCKPGNLAKLPDNKSPLVQKMHAINRAAHLTRAVHDLRRPERGWYLQHARLVLQTVEILDDHGLPVVFLRAGDVMVREHQWDRDVIVTHSPRRELMGGSLLHGRTENTVGIFLPLFDRETITNCVWIMIAKNAADARTLVEQEAKDWGWK